MHPKRTDFFRYLHLLVMLPDVKPDGLPVDERIKEAVAVREYNRSYECTFDNHWHGCKSRYLYLVVTTTSQFDPAFGIELGPSFGWDLTWIARRELPHPCVLFKMN